MSDSPGPPRRPKTFDPAPWPSLLLASLLALTSSGCAMVSGTIPARSDPPGTGIFLAGGARVDITPAPGLPMGGYSIAGKVSRGHWLRLYARAIYVEDPNGKRLALVSCDLWSVPAGLADRVADRLADSENGIGIGREQLVLAATHTHQSPGNFSTSIAYNDLAAPRSGFNDDLFDFLVDKIVEAIRRAHESREAAVAFFGESKLDRFFRNRSLEPFLLNPEAERILKANERDLHLCTPSLSDFRDGRACRAVDPRVAVIELERASDRSLIAAAVFVAVHPTVMSNEVPVYSGDLFAYAARSLELKLAPTSSSKSPVVAFFNGAAGDITTTWESRNRLDLIHLGGMLAGAVERARRKAKPMGVQLGFRYDVFELAGGCFVDAENNERCAADQGLPGAATLGGAEDGWTPLRDLGFREGRRGPVRGEHGPKLPAFDIELGGIHTRSITPFMERFLFRLPKKVPLGIYQLGRYVLATLPGEFTSTMGRRIEASLQAHPTLRPERVLLVGPAGEYLSYFATPEEYEAQHYEGASTMYGPAAGPLVAHQLKYLAGPLGNADNEPLKRRYRHTAGLKKKPDFELLGPPSYGPLDGLTAIVRDPETGAIGWQYHRVCWKEEARSTRRGRRSTPKVVVEREGANQTLEVGGVPQDDEGLNFLAVASKAEDGRARWCAIWMHPHNTPDQTYVFHVETVAGADRRSEPFRLGDAWKEHQLAP